MPWPYNVWSWRKRWSWRMMEPMMCRTSEPWWWKWWPIYLYLPTIIRYIFCTRYVNIVDSLEVFQFIYLPCSLILGWRGPLLQWFFCRTPWKRPRWRFGDIKTERVSHGSNIKTKKVKLPDIIQTKDGRHYRNSQTRRTRESEYLIDLISSDHSEYGIDGCWPGICS